MLTPGTTGEVLKWNNIVVLPFDKVAEFAEVPLTVKSLAWTVTGSTGSLTLIMKSVGWVKTITPHDGLVTVQGVAVTAARTSKSAATAMINVAARVIFIFHYHFVVAVWSRKTSRSGHQKNARDALDATRTDSENARSRRELSNYNSTKAV